MPELYDVNYFFCYVSLATFQKLSANQAFKIIFDHKTDMIVN